MRVFASVVVLSGALAAAACSDATPSEPLPTPSYAPVPGTGNPAVDAALATLNNQVVGCALSGNLDHQRASHLALLIAILRFTPGGSSNKTEALLRAITLQIQHAQRKDEISPACVAQLTGTIESIEDLL
jgi:hypothetical protein